MRIVSLQLEKFRNYASQTIEFNDRDVQLFIGRNGSGKTNVIEAISLLSLTKSCRGRDDREMVQWDQQYYRIRARVQADNEDRTTMEVVCEVQPRKKKGFFRNDVRSTVSGMIGFLPTVTFLPQDLLLFSGPPAERRRFLDQLLCQVTPEYMTGLVQYQKVLQQRNALLRKILSGEPLRSSLDVWDAEVASKGSAITLARLEMIATLNVTFKEQMADLGEMWDDVSLRYQRKTEAQTAEELEQEMMQRLAETRERDILLQSTSTGPHREDWQVFSGARALPTFASRGQERSAVLALLLLEVSYLELRRGEKPVILLDDAFSELDDDHQSALLQAFLGYQVIMTSTRIPPNAEHAAVHDVAQGIVTVA